MNRQRTREKNLEDMIQLSELQTHKIALEYNEVRIYNSLFVWINMTAGKRGILFLLLPLSLSLSLSLFFRSLFRSVALFLILSPSVTHTHTDILTLFLILSCLTVSLSFIQPFFRSCGWMELRTLWVVS